LDLRVEAIAVNMHRLASTFRLLKLGKNQEGLKILLVRGPSSSFGVSFCVLGRVPGFIRLLVPGFEISHVDWVVADSGTCLECTRGAICRVSDFGFRVQDSGSGCAGIPMKWNIQPRPPMISLVLLPVHPRPESQKLRRQCPQTCRGHEAYFALQSGVECRAAGTERVLVWLRWHTDEVEVVISLPMNVKSEKTERNAVHACRSASDRRQGSGRQKR
jgi:hypothetical protein